MMTKKAQYWIERLGLEPHPEGGYFKEIYRSDIKIAADALPDHFKYPHNIVTSIYFLITKDSFSAFHRLKADEVWHFYAGAPLTVYVIQKDGTLHTQQLGTDPEKEQYPQIVVPKDQWFCAVTNVQAGYSLVGCTVAPGFSFKEGFELGKKKELLSVYPQHRALIEKYSKP